MKTVILSLLLFCSILFGAFRIEQFQSGNAYPQLKTRYLIPQNGSYLQATTNPSDLPFLRRRFSYSEYRLYEGRFSSFSETPTGNLQAFIRPNSMSRQEFYEMKYYDRIRMNGQGDITDCYFHEDTLYVVGLNRVLYFQENEWFFIDSHLPNQSIEKGRGDIALQSTPPGAEIFINGIKRGVVTPNYITDLTEGTHRIRLEHPDFAPVETTVVVKNSDITEMDIELTSRYGGVRFTGFPRGAKVTLNGQTVGKLPCSVEPLRPGSYLFVVDEPFHKRKEIPVEVRSGSTQEISVMLSKSYGVISLPDVPSNTPWKINGEVVASGALRFNPGTHRIFWSGGTIYRSIDTVISLSLGDTVALDTRFAKRTGGIKVLPIPMACSLFVNGTFRGEAPMVLDDVAVGTHTIELRRKGYAPHRRTVSVEGDDVQLVRCELKKAGVKPTPKVKTERKQFVQTAPQNSLGQLSFVSFPPCAEVYSGDSLVAITGKGTVKIPAGRYSFRFVNGNQTEVKNVHVGPGDKKAVLVTFGEM